MNQQLYFLINHLIPQWTISRDKVESAPSVYSQSTIYNYDLFFANTTELIESIQSYNTYYDSTANSGITL